jgi:hypothetical protein
VSRSCGRTAGTDTSLPWQGEDPDEIELVVGQSFTLEGTLTLPDWSDLDPNYHGERRILVSGLTDDLWRPLARLRSVEAGAWGPLLVPLRGVSRVRVRLEGSPIIPMERELAAPVPGSRERIDWAAKKGCNLWFGVQDSSESPLPTARAEVSWNDPEQPSGTGRVEFGAMPDGRINTWSFPAGVVSYRISAPGFASFESLIEVPAEVGPLITLQKGGRITGHCTQAGAPVRDFEIDYRREGPNKDDRTKVFLNRRDGRFEIDNLAAGNWLVSAASPRSPGSIPAVVSVAADRDSTVELELPAPLRGVGRVVDAASGEPLSSATVQVFSGGLERSQPWGAPFPVAQDGTFDLDAFVPGRNFITVSAKDHAARELESALVGDLLDWGEIALFRPQGLRIRLVGGAPPGVRLADLRVMGQATQPLPDRRFDASGEAYFEEVSPGNCMVGIIEPGGNAWTRVDLELVAGASWDFDCRLVGPRKLDVLVRRADDEPLDYAPVVMASAQEETGHFVLRARQTHEGRVSFEGIRAERVQLSVVDGQSQVVATREIHFEGRERVETELLVGEKPLRIHVVDGDGAPIAGAWVRTRSPSDAHIFGMDDTDSDGWASQFGLPEDTVLSTSSTASPASGSACPSTPLRVRSSSCSKPRARSSCGCSTARKA